MFNLFKEKMDLLYINKDILLLKAVLLIIIFSPITFLHMYKYICKNIHWPDNELSVA